MAVGRKYSEVQREQLLQAEDKWIVQFDIINHEGKEQKYTIAAFVGSEKYIENILISDGGTYAYLSNIPRDMAGDVAFAIYREGDVEPFKQVKYYLK